MFLQLLETVGLPLRLARVIVMRTNRSANNREVFHERKRLLRCRRTGRIGLTRILSRSSAIAWLSLITVSFVMVLAPASVMANPSGANVVHGSADISKNGNTLNIRTSDWVIINWQDFSIANGEITNFLQPSSSSAALNRVLGGNPSSIYGTLNANGNVFLINPNGVIVGDTGVINAGGFMASTLDVLDEDFINGGDLTFMGDSRASVENLGQISVSGGDVFLIAHSVKNSGSIIAPGGVVGMAAGQEVLLADSGEERLMVRPATNTLSDSDNPTEVGVENTGAIDTTRAELKAAGGNIYALAINNEGSIRATGVENVNGRIVLRAGGGNVTTSGNLTASNADRSGGEVIIDGGVGIDGPSTTIVGGIVDVSSRLTDEELLSAEADLISKMKGGKVDITGDQVALIDDAKIDASGEGGGGEVRIGGDYLGKNPDIPNAKAAYFGKDARVFADAVTQGDGGRVILWSDETTRFHGQIFARGGTQGGSGGFIETSGKIDLEALGLAWVESRDGLSLAGQWLLDPNNITVTSGADNLISLGPSFLSLGDGSVLSAASLTAALNAGGTVTITTDAAGANSEAGDVTFQASLTLSPVAAATLIVNAHRHIIFDASTDITASGLSPLNIDLNADGVSPDSIGGIFIGANSSFTTNGGTFDANGSRGPGLGNGTGVTLSSGSNVTTNGGDVTIVGVGDDTSFGRGIYMASGSSIDAGTGAINMTGTSGVTGTGGRGIEMVDANISNSGAGSIILSGTSQGNGSFDNVGVFIDGTSSIANSGTGNILITGNGGSGTVGNKGIYVDRFGAASGQLFVLNGTLTLDGNAGVTGTDSIGVHLREANIQAALGGDIVIDGDSSSAGLGSHGVFLQVITGNNTITSNTNNISIDGATTSSNANVFGTSIQGTNITTTSGTISVDGAGQAAEGLYILGSVSTFNGGSTGGLRLRASTVSGADSIDITNLTMTGNGSLTFAPLDLTETIGIGNGATGVFNLSGTLELDGINDGFSQVTFGDGAQSGTMTIESFSFQDNVSFNTNGGTADIVVNGTVDTGISSASGNINLFAGGSVITGGSSSVTAPEGTISLNAKEDVEIGGTISHQVSSFWNISSDTDSNGTGGIKISGTLSGGAGISANIAELTTDPGFTLYVTNTGVINVPGAMTFLETLNSPTDAGMRIDGSITSTNSNITFHADDLDIGGAASINAGFGDITINAGNPSDRIIELGPSGSSGGKLTIGTAESGAFQAGELIFNTVSTDASGAIQLNNAGGFAPNVNQVTLNASGTGSQVAFTSGTSTFTSLDLNANGDVTFNSATVQTTNTTGQDSGVIDINSSSGNITGTGVFTITTGTVTASSGFFTSGNVIINVSGSVNGVFASSGVSNSASVDNAISGNVTVTASSIDGSTFRSGDVTVNGTSGTSGNVSANISGDITNSSFLTGDVTDSGFGFATSGNIDLDALSIGVSGTPVNTDLGTPTSGGSFITHGQVDLTTTGGAGAGGIFVQSSQDIFLGSINMTAALNAIDISTAGAQDIRFDTSFTSTGTASNTILITTGGGDIIFDTSGTLDGDTFILDAGGTGAVQMNTATLSSASVANAVTIQNATTVGLGNINVGSGNLILGIGNNITGVVTQTPATSINANLLIVSTGSSVDLSSSTNDVATLSVVQTNGNFSLSDGTSGITVAGVITTNGGNLDITSTAGDILLSPGTSITTGGAVPGGDVTLTSNTQIFGSAGAVIDTTGTGGGGGVLSTSGTVTMGTAPTVGDGNVTLTGGILTDLHITTDLIAPIINLAVSNDIKIDALVQSTSGNVTIEADSDNDGVGGVLITTAGEVISAGTITISGSEWSNSTLTGGAVNRSIEIEADGSNDQLTSVGNVNLSSKVLGAASGLIEVSGDIQITGAGSTLVIDSESATGLILRGRTDTNNGDITLVDGGFVNGTYDAFTNGGDITWQGIINPQGTTMIVNLDTDGGDVDFQTDVGTGALDFLAFTVRDAHDVSFGGTVEAQALSVPGSTGKVSFAAGAHNLTATFGLFIQAEEIEFSAGSSLSTVNLTLAADEIDFLGGANSIDATGDITIEGDQDTDEIIIGGVDTILANQLFLDNVDIAALDTSYTSITFGAASQSGNVTYNSGSFVADTKMQTSGSLILNADLNITNGGSLELKTDNLNLGFNLFTIGGDIILDTINNIVLTNDVVLDAANGVGVSGDILFNPSGSMNGTTAGEETLYINTGGTTLDGNLDLGEIGSVVPLGEINLTLDNGEAHLYGSISLTSAGSHSGTFAIGTPGGVVALQNSIIVNTDGGDFDTFANFITSGFGPFNLQVNTGGGGFAGDAIIGEVGDFDGAGTDFTLPQQVILDVGDTLPGVVQLNENINLDGTSGGLFRAIGGEIEINATNLMISTNADTLGDGGLVDFDNAGFSVGGVSGGMSLSINTSSSDANGGDIFIDGNIDDAFTTFNLNNLNINTGGSASNGVTTLEDVQLDGNMVVSGDVNLGGNITTSSFVTINGDLQFLGSGNQDITSLGNVGIFGNAFKTTAGSLEIAGPSVDIDGDLFNSGGVLDINNTTNVEGDIDATTVNINADLTMDGTTDQFISANSGNINVISGNISSSTPSKLRLSASSLIDLTEIGNVTIDGGTGDLVLDAPNISRTGGGNLFLSGSSVSINGDINVAGGNLTVTDDLVATGDITNTTNNILFQGGVDLAGLGNQAIDASGTMTFDSTLTKSSPGGVTLGAGSGISIIGDTTISNGGITFLDAATASGDILTTGLVDFQDSATFNGTAPDQRVDGSTVTFQGSVTKTGGSTFTINANDINNPTGGINYTGGTTQYQGGTLNYAAGGTGTENFSGLSGLNLTTNTTFTAGVDFTGVQINALGFDITVNAGGNLVTFDNILGVGTLSLNSAAGSTFNGVVQGTNLIVNSPGPFVRFNGPIIFNTATFGAGSYNVDLFGGGGIGGPVTFNTSGILNFGNGGGDAFTVGGNLTAIAPSTINLFGEVNAAGGTLNLGTAVLQGSSSISGSTVVLSGNITEGGASSLAIRSASGFTTGSIINLPNSDVLFDSPGQVVNLTGGHSLGSVGVRAGSATLNVSGDMELNGGTQVGNLNITGVNNLTQSGPISVGTLNINNTGTIDLMSPENRINNIGNITRGGNTFINSRDGLDVTGVIAGNLSADVTLRTIDGDLTLRSGSIIRVGSLATALVVADQGLFINEAGQSAFDIGVDGRYGIYSQFKDLTNLGGLMPFEMIGGTFPGNPGPSGGNFVVYEFETSIEVAEIPFQDAIKPGGPKPTGPFKPEGPKTEEDVFGGPEGDQKPPINRGEGGGPGDGGLLLVQQDVIEESPNTVVVQGGRREAPVLIIKPDGTKEFAKDPEIIIITRQALDKDTRGDLLEALGEELGETFGPEFRDAVIAGLNEVVKMDTLSSEVMERAPRVLIVALKPDVKFDLLDALGLDGDLMGGLSGVLAGINEFIDVGSLSSGGMEQAPEFIIIAITPQVKQDLESAMEDF